jgi:hypothetical protein
MRYCIQPATSVDVAFLATAMDEDGEVGGGRGGVVPIDRLLQTCACSTQIWAARNEKGMPSALWGVAPGADDPDIGHLWMLACEVFDDEPGELQQLSRLVFGEMLAQFPRLENFIDARKIRAIELLRSIGFEIEPAVQQSSEEAGLRLAWIDSDRLHGGCRAGMLPS